jgi:sn-glycerol 3-phosphate transport system ATP-binding protein
MSDIVLDNITKQFGTAAPAVQNISFTVEAGTFTVLLGP